jgi:flagellar protein FliO/FliZ
MTQSLLIVGFFVAVLACLPFILKWVKQRVGTKAVSSAEHSKFISAVAVGPHQSVVTIEAGPQGARVWLTLGVTQQSISCLHVAPVGVSAEEVGALGSGSAKLCT